MTGINIINPRVHNSKSLAKQAQIAAEYGKDFYSVLADFAKEHSFTFTMQALELNKGTYTYCKPLFTPRLMQKQERPYMSGNRHAAKYPPIPADCPVRKSTVYWRLHHGWTWEQAVRIPIMSTSKTKIANLGAKRNTTTWKAIISKECEGVKDFERKR